MVTQVLLLTSPQTAIESQKVVRTWSSAKRAPGYQPQRIGAIDTPQGGTRSEHRGFGPQGPVVIGDGIAFHGPGVRLVEPVRYTLSRRATIYRIFSPVVVAPPIAFSGPSVCLETRLSRNFVRRAVVYSLHPPTAVTPAATFYATPISVNLVTRGRRPGVYFKTTSFLCRPVRIGSVAFYGPSVVLAYSRRGVSKSALHPPTVIAGLVLSPPVVAHLAYSRRGVPKSFLRKPIRVGSVAFYGPSVVRAAYSYDTRRRPWYLLLNKPLPQPFVEPLARPIKTVLAPSPAAAMGQRVPRSRLYPLPPGISFAIARPIDGTLAEHPRRQPTRPWLRDAVVVFAPAPTVSTLRKSLAPAPRRATYSRLPKVIFQPVVTTAAPISVHLTRTRPPITRAFVRGPVVVFPPVPVETTVSVALVRIRPVTTRSILGRPVVAGTVFARAIVVCLAPQKRGRPKSILSHPVVVGPVLARPIQRTLVRIRPRPTTAHLFAPAVVFYTPADAVADVTLAYSRRGTAKSFLRPMGPGAVVYAPLSVHLIRIRPVRTLTALRKPAVIDLTPQTKFISTHLAYSRRGTPKSFLGRPADLVDAQDLGYVKAHLAYSRRGRPIYRLAPPAVVAPVLARKINVTLVRIRPRPTTNHLFPPTSVFQAVELSGPRTVLAYSLRGVPKSFLGKPTDLVDQQDLGYLRTHLAYSRRGRPVYILHAPTVVGPVLARPIAIHLAPSFRGRPLSTLHAPAVVAPVLARAILVALTRIRPASVHSALRPATIIFSQTPADAVADITLVQIRPVATHSRLAPPTVIFPFFARALDITLAPQRRGIPHSFLRPMGSEAVVYAPIRVELAYSLRGKAKSSLGRPTDLVDQQDLGFIRVHLAYSLRGVPKSILRTPTVVFSQTPADAVADITLVRIRPVATHSKLFPPTVVFPFFARATDTTFAPQRRGAPHSFLRPMGSPAVVYAPVKVELAYSRRGVPKSILGRPTDLVDQQDLGYVKAHLAYSRRGTPKSILRKPTVVAPVLARAIAAHLAPSFRGQPKSILRLPIIPPVAPPIDEEIAVKITLASLPPRRAHSRLFPPAVVAPVLARPIEVTLARIRPPKTVVALRPPAIVFSSTPADAVADITLVQIRPAATHSRLSPPTVVFPFFARQTDIELAPSSRGQAKSFLRPMGSEAVVYAPIFIKLAPSTRIPRAPHSKLTPPIVIDLRPQAYYLNVNLAYSLRGAPKSILRKPSKIATEVYFGPTTKLAYSLRGTPKPFLSPPTDVKAATVYLRPIDVTLAPQRRGKAKPFLRNYIVAPFSNRPVSVNLAPSSRGLPHSFLRSTIYAAKVYAPISITLAPQRRGVAKSILNQVVYDAKVYAPIKITLAASPRLDRAPHSRLEAPTVVEAFFARPTIIVLAPQRLGTAKSFLLQTIYEARSYAPIRVVLAPAPRLDRAQHSRLSPPAVVGEVLVDQIIISLAPSSRGKPFSRLTEVVFEGRVYAPIKITLAPSPRLDRTPHSRLVPPTVVAKFIARPISIKLARTKLKSTINFLRPPVLARTFRGINITLAKIRPPRTIARILPPAVVTPYVAPIVTGLSVNLAYSVRGVTKSFITFNPGKNIPGTVCGFVLDLTEVCEVIMTDASAILPGEVLNTGAVRGEVAGVEVIIGEDMNEYRVDQEIE